MAGVVANTYSTPNPVTRSSFRTSMFQPEGLASPQIIEGVVIEHNLLEWTVGVRAKHDRKYYGDAQVSSPYLHPHSGEGVYVVPEIGSKCHICIPSDGTPPYVMDFVMPSETPDGGGTTFQGGRLRQKPGDIVMRGRDGNFCILHRGGVLQIGSTSLAQRIYIPIENIVTDISQNYRHYNTSGAINWGVIPGGPEDKLPVHYKQTFRLFGDQQFASVRIAVGSCKDFLTEPQGGVQLDLEELEMATKDNPIVMEVALAPEGFNADAGDVTADTPGLTKLRYFFDKAGSVLLKSEGSILIRAKKKLKVKVDDDARFEFGKSCTMSVGKSFRVEAKDGVMELSSNTLSFNGGSKPIATVGSVVDVAIGAPIQIMVNGVPGVITAGQKLTGIVSTGNPTVRA